MKFYGAYPENSISLGAQAGRIIMPRYRLPGIIFASLLCFAGAVYAVPISPVHPSPGRADSIGPFEIADPDSTTKIRLQFAGQLRAQFESRDAGRDRERTDKFFAEARRIRLILAGDFPSYNLTFKLHLSLAPGSLELMDMQFDYRCYRSNHIRIGQYKVPFTRYRIQSFQRLTFADWAIVTRYFGAERQMGLTVHNGYEKPPTWAYEVGVFTGQNARASHAVGLAGIYGEAVPNPSDLADPGPKAEFHPAVFGHVSYNPNGISVQSDSDDKGVGLRGSAGFSAGWDLDPNRYQNLTGRFAPEILLKYRGASFSGIGYLGLVKIGCPGATRTGMTGALVQGAYRFAGRYEVAARYAIVDFADELTSAAYSRAQRLITLAQYEADLSDSPIAQKELDSVMTQYKNAGILLGEEEITIGFNIYIESHLLKWQNDAGRLLHHRRDQDRVDYVVRSQLQLTF